MRDIKKIVYKAHWQKFKVHLNKTINAQFCIQVKPELEVNTIPFNKVSLKSTNAKSKIHVQAKRLPYKQFSTSIVMHSHSPQRRIPLGF